MRRAPLALVRLVVLVAARGGVERASEPAHLESERETTTERRWESSAGRRDGRGDAWSEGRGERGELGP